ncbi:hypothetical protein [Deinococcus navajonensis]|uniref:Uncharacterized protein n=1 Tax=Deinococcus navajonensis TaxID=309884 RepID=A0ABV8XLM7_9DEIO
MTDPDSVTALKRDPNAARVIGELWSLDPDSAASVALWVELRRSVDTGSVVIARHPGGTKIGFYFCTPYAPTYEARRPVVTGDTALARGQCFPFERAAASATPTS